ncbi:hypothetical protein BV22DRAFT_1135473 [Leucogyrophana mollusca]|uniref:Uncharacterized protein n=1 Tax=Leucogyrophana mollusca TaxID=85980 RepID=A0ACB8AVG4_9AGAM|nr:hypothetical protein BV22DRAFT_1135473 [Leucogyrophana mollusca]
MVPRYSHENFLNILKLAGSLQTIGSQYGATTGQVALTWLLAQGDDVTLIPGTVKIKFTSDFISAPTEAGRHFVDSGLAWQTKVPQFQRDLLVSSAIKEGAADSPPSLARIIAQRRFSHFVALHAALLNQLPGIALPPLPEKQYAGQFSADFVEARRGDLKRYIGRVVRHPIARYAEVITSFLGCENDSEWTRLIPQHLSMLVAGPSFFAHVLHPAFNIDVDEAMESADWFNNYTWGVRKSVHGLRSAFGWVSGSETRSGSKTY